MNGLIVFSHYRNVGLANNDIAINNRTLTGGPQNVTIKLFPLGNMNGKEYPLLLEKTHFELKIFKRDKATTWKGLDYEVVQEYFATTTG